MTKSMEKDLKRWHEFMNRQAPMCVKSIPRNERGCEWIVVPKEDENFWMGDFSTNESAIEFCQRNGLPIIGRRSGGSRTTRKNWTSGRRSGKGSRSRW